MVAATAREGLEASASASAARTSASDKAVRQLEWGADTLQALEVCIEKGYISARWICFLETIRNSALKRLIFNFNLKKAKHINTVIKRTSGGATCGVEGVSGAICASGIVTILNCVHGGVAGKRVFDFGAGCGLFLFIASAMGALNAGGTELRSNIHSYGTIFEAVKRKLPGIDPSSVNIWFQGIEAMKTLEQADVIWDFWDGHSAEDRNITTTLVSKSTSAMFFACTNARGESIEGVLHDLN